MLVFHMCIYNAGVSHVQCLKKWGFRRCEDICWIKTNIRNPGHNKNLEPKAIFQRTKVITTAFTLNLKYNVFQL